MISVGSKQLIESDPLDPEIINRLENEFQYNVIDCNYYNNEDGDEVYLRRVLKWYQDYFKSNSEGASILFPIGALRSLRRLCKFANNKAIIISGDKGNNNPEQFVGLLDPHIAIHGSFSLMVNYHAIGAWVTNKGGFALHNPQEEASLKVGCFVLLPNNNVDISENEDINYLNNNINELDTLRSKDFPHLRYTFHENLNLFGPNDFFVLQKSLKEDITAPPLRTVISILKLSDWDPDVFFKFRDIILNQAPNCGSKLRNDLTRGIDRIWKNYYLMDFEKDIAFEIGRYYYGIKEYNNALQYYIKSMNTIGPHHVTYHNQGLCHYSLGNYVISLELFHKALNMNSEYEKAKNWIEKVKTEMEQKKDVTNENKTDSNDMKRLIEEVEIIDINEE